MARLSSTRAEIPTEDQEQIALIQWANTQPSIKDLLFHSPNGGSRHKLEALKLKRMGVKAGVPDLFLPIPTSQHHGLFIELKRRRLSTLTIEQKWWLNALAERGYCAEVAYGWEEAKNIIEEYMT